MSQKEGDEKKERLMTVKFSSTHPFTFHSRLQILYLFAQFMKSKRVDAVCGEVR